MSRQYKLRTLFAITTAAAVAAAVLRHTGVDLVLAIYGLFWITFAIGAIRENRRRTALRLQHVRASHDSTP